MPEHPGVTPPTEFLGQPLSQPAEGCTNLALCVGYVADLSNAVTAFREGTPGAELGRPFTRLDHAVLSTTRHPAPESGNGHGDMMLAVAAEAPVKRGVRCEGCLATCALTILNETDLDETERPA